VQSQPLDDSYLVTFEQFSTHLRVNYRRIQLNKSYRFLKDEQTSISINAIHDYHEHFDEASFCPFTLTPLLERKQTPFTLDCFKQYY